MKAMTLKADTTEFKIADTNTLFHFTALIDNVPQTFKTEDELFFQIKMQNGRYLQPATATANGNDVVLNSKSISNLPVGNYQLELWHTNNDGSRDIFPANGFLDLKIVENAVGGNPADLEQMSPVDLYNKIMADVSERLNAAIEKIPGGKDGTNGIDGNSPTIQVGQTVETAPGTQARVEDIGGSLNHVFNFYIPKAKLDVVNSINSSLKDCKDSGLYMGIGTGTDAPTQGRYSMFVNADDKGASQLLFDLANGNVYSRTFDGYEWAAWRQVTQWN